MGKVIKYFLLFAGGLVVLTLAAIFVAPKFIDVQKYKPLLVEKVAAATGRKVSLGGDLNISVFPWVGVSFTDLRLGNPEGFEGKDFVKVKSFEAHVKVMPLLSKEVQIDNFVLDGPEIYLEKRKDGRGNWERLGGAAGNETVQKGQVSKGEQERFGLKSIEISKFSIINGTISLVDKQRGSSKEISSLTLQLTDVSLERPIALIFSAMIDGKAVGGSGQFGPLGSKPGEGRLPLDLTITALEQLEAKIKGQLDNPAGDLSYKLKLDVTQFSPRKLLSSQKMVFPVETSDPAVLDAVALSMNLSGGAKSAVVTDGKIMFDGSKIELSGNANTFTPLNLVLDGSLDSIDLDRYLPPRKEQAKDQTASNVTGAVQEKKRKTDYEPFRKLLVDAQLAVGELKVQGGKMHNINMHLTAKNGIIKAAPFTMELYGGKVSSTAVVNVQTAVPATSIELKTENIQVGPLLKDFAKKDVLEGTLVSSLVLTTKGDMPEEIKRTLNGKGELLFTDGAIVGIDLAGMVRNVQASFGLADRPTEKPRTDFAELRAPFTIKDGLAFTPETALQSPLMRVSVSGTANLVTETLDMKIQPKFVATLKGQGDTAKRQGLVVPVLVKGTFDAPVFSPDLTALLQGQLPDAESVKKALEQELNPEKLIPKGQDGSTEGGLKSLIPKFKLK